MNCYSNGKFLITGEYLVMNGALALAVPLTLGQGLLVTETAQAGRISWKSYVNGKLWFEATFSSSDFGIITTGDSQKAEFLAGLLKQAHQLNPASLKLSNGYDVVSQIGFDINWGLGSSSTLITNIARWFEVDPFALHFAVSSGSGYDIACATTESPILYQLTGKKPHVEPVTFNPDFSESIYFVYLGKKQDSAKSIRNFSQKIASTKNENEHISSLTKEIVNAGSLQDFDKLIAEHEQIISAVLGVPAIKHNSFSDFDGQMKSLGAWGGDFMMVTWPHDEALLRAYLDQKGLKTCFSFKEIVLQPGNSAGAEIVSGNNREKILTNTK
jgi:mevalonate kinase